MHLSIRWKLILSIVLPLVVIAVIVMVITFDLLYQRAKDTLHEQATTLAQHYAARLDGQFQSFAQVARSTAAFLEIHPDATEAELYALLRANVTQNSMIYGSAIAYEPYSYRKDTRIFSPYVYRDDNGFHEMDVATDSYDYSNGEWEWFSAPRTLGHSIWTEPFFDEGAGDILMVTHSAPFSVNGEFRGVATIDIPLGKLQEILGMEQLGDLPFVIISPSGKFISHPNPELIMTETIQGLLNKSRDPGYREFTEDMMAGNSGVGIVDSLYSVGFRSNSRSWLFYAPIKTPGWAFATAVSEATMTANVRHQLTRGAVGLMIIVILVILCILLVSTSLTRPIMRLATAVNRLGRGDFDIKVTGSTSQDEIGQLTTGFNNMVDQLNNHITALTHEVAARESMENELRVARNIQSSLLPTKFPPFPERKEFELHAVNLAAHHVAGDFFDFFFIDHETLMFIIADVSGKGIPAAMVMAVTRTMIRNLAKTGVNPAKIISETNNHLIENRGQPIFVTMFLGSYHVASGMLIYSNAGHHPPYILGQNGELNRFAGATGTIVGMLEDAHYQDQTTTINPGEYLVLYTDGLPDARSPDGKFYGETFFKALLVKNAGVSTDTMCETIIEEITEFQAHELNDDVTLMILKRNT